MARSLLCPASLMVTFGVKWVLFFPLLPPYMSDIKNPFTSFLEEEESHLLIPLGKTEPLHLTHQRRAYTAQHMHSQ